MTDTDIRRAVREHVDRPSWVRVATFIGAVLFGAWAGAAFLSLIGCVAYAPDPPPTVVAPPPTRPVDPPAPVAPVSPPADVQDALARLLSGQTLAQATAAMGTAPKIVPASQGAEATARWTVGSWMVFATLSGDGKVTGKGRVQIGSNP